MHKRTPALGIALLAAVILSPSLGPRELPSPPITPQTQQGGLPPGPLMVVYYRSAPFVIVHALYHRQLSDRWPCQRAPLRDVDLAPLDEHRLWLEVGSRGTAESTDPARPREDGASSPHFLLSGQQTA